MSFKAPRPPQRRPPKRRRRPPGTRIATMAWPLDSIRGVANARADHYLCDTCPAYSFLSYKSVVYHRVTTSAGVSAAVTAVPLPPGATAPITSVNTPLRPDRRLATQSGRASRALSGSLWSPSRGAYNLLIMNCVPCEGDGDEACANCGKLGSDAVKLKNCTACRLVKYCGVDCQRAHRKKHKKACKQRVAELKDEQLYNHGLERPEGDFCPICTLPIPFRLEDHSVFNTCCMKRICHGCAVAAQKRGMRVCSFCRTPPPDNETHVLARIQARVAKKDPEGINQLGQKYYHGSLGLQKDMQRAVKLWEEAAELGSIEALFCLGNAHHKGDGVQQGNAKAAQFWTKAAMQGHVLSRANLGWLEGEKGNQDREARHNLISAKMGHTGSVENIKTAFKAGFATKEHYAEALKGYQDAIEEMKSHDRNEAKAYLDNRKISTPRY
ncbi:hypothetical protein THAOC_14083 [Thalassiosira oceanica]|uniref:MYND-type domain-containing protein n=1 Tax=Thalassiosira oceanica TaxID=159749 RepID=K0SJJ0_THAOC|nr:hypothetical protein THAOC_14083 [Thalassiosira oceanica]|eukprot:EJK65109.1 hypothetical protein THAOC_14083 [Thalassiosira oceanica]